MILQRTLLLFMVTSLVWGGDLTGDLSYSHGAIIRGSVDESKIYLVFTGHDFNDGRWIIRRTLKRHDVPANFFFTGDFYRNPENKRLVKKLIRDGHYLGAHSDKHLLYASWENRDSLLVSKRVFTQDLLDNYTEMKRFGITRAPYYLPPYEWYNATIAGWTSELGLTLVNYTPGTLSHADYTTPEMKSYRDSQTLYDNMLTYADTSRYGLNGFILLIHLGTHPDRTDKLYNRLDALIPELKQRGYTFSKMDLMSLK